MTPSKISFTRKQSVSAVISFPWTDCFGAYTVSSEGSNGDKYVGEFKDGKMNGHGTYTHAKGDSYVGEWKDGKKNGHGTYTYASGNKYVGEFKDDKCNGHGTYTYGPKSNWAGDKYVGEWKDDKHHGQGIYHPYRRKT